ncbi:MAG: hypothetical protein JSR80_07600 [Verrucomicrobia bacterium]|nr:hypothetical protein [Verrucomicrobiota bacterium]
MHLRSVVGGALLIAGSCIGIGMLALPVTTGTSGFLPAVVLLLVAALFMGSTALLLVEVDLDDRANANILSLAEHNLGRGAKVCASIAYLFLFYCLMVAYVTKGGEVLQLLLHTWGALGVTNGLGSFLLVVIAAIAIFCGRAAVDVINRVFMAGLLFSFLVLIVIGLEQFNPVNLTHRDWTKTIPAIPFVITAFGFHNMIPTVSDYVGRDRRRLIQAVMLGGGIAFIVYFVWMFTVQGASPVKGEIGIQAAFDQGWIGTQLLYAISQNMIVKIGALYLSFFAIITSVLGQGLGLVDFLFDGLKLTYNRTNRGWLLALIFIPSFVAARLIPGVFFLALKLAGGVAAIFLFGLLPALMVWSHRKRFAGAVPLVKGGKGFLLVISVCSALLLLYELFHFLM